MKHHHPLHYKEPLNQLKLSLCGWPMSIVSDLGAVSGTITAVQKKSIHQFQVKNALGHWMFEASYLPRFKI